jgi:hypothetical protein
VNSLKFALSLRCEAVLSADYQDHLPGTGYLANSLREVDNMNGGKGIYIGGTLVSILISLALYATGRRESAIFVGLWAPTILNLGQSLLEED